MSTNLERFRNDVAELKSLGDKMTLDLRFRRMGKTETLAKKYQETAKKVEGSFERNYQRWYTEACAVIKQLVPDRLPEFIQLYHGDPKGKQSVGNAYSVSDWLNGVRSCKHLDGSKIFDDFGIVEGRFHTQYEILKAIESRFESSLFDIAQLVRADLFDSELDVARELAKKGFLRGAGAVAGVVIEKHLAQVCSNHNVTTRKKHPTISDFNDLLKTAGVLDVPMWRRIQRLGDIRNLCDHNKQREPTKEDVPELIDGAGKLCKTLF